MKIRPETHKDYSSIELITYEAFLNHPHHAPGAKPTEHLIINSLRDTGALALSLVAEDESGVIGHIAVSPVKIDGRVSSWYGLGPISVAPGKQGQGIGGQLIKKAMAEMKTLGAEGLVLLGEPEYYTRFGFKPSNCLTLPGVPGEYFMIQSLCDGDAEIPSGEVAYSPAFG